MGVRLDRDARRVLDTLGSGPCSISSLVDQLDLPQGAIDRRLERLRDAGFVIASQNGEVVLQGNPGYPAGIAQGLEAPFALECHDAIGSTNDRARALGRTGDHDIVVVAARQTSGRGRRDRTWTSPPGGMWGSVVVRPSFPRDRWSLLTFAGAVAVVAAVETLDVDARIKWPNDVLLGESGGKLAGVLTVSGRSTAGEPWVGVGIGVNADVDPAALPAGAASLRSVVDGVDRCRLGRSLLEAFDAIRDRPDAILTQWRAAADTLGRRVRVETPDGPVVGRAEGVDGSGALRVATDGEVQTVTVGDCEHLRPA